MTQQDGAVVEYVPVSLDVLGSKRPQEVLRLKYDVAHIMQAVLIGPTVERPEGIHYGPSFPGSKKNSLLLPGAHTLASTFGLTPTYEVTEIPEGKGRRYQVRTKMHSRSGLFLGEGIGEASTEEEKFAWQEVVCEAQYQAADPLDVRIKYKKDDRVEAGYVEIKQIRTNVADKSNTALKIGKKRSFVDGVILVLDCSDIFDQDFEELSDELGFERVTQGEPREPRKPKPKPAPIIPYGKHKDRQITDPEVPTDYLQWLSDKTAAGLKEVTENPKHNRARFKAQDTIFLAALDAEIAFRKANQPKEEPKQPEEGAQTPQNPAKAGPGEAQTAKPIESTQEGRKPFSESSWADFIIYCEEEAPEQYKTAKAAFLVQSGHDLPVAQRIPFYDMVMAAVEKAKK